MARVEDIGELPGQKAVHSALEPWLDRRLFAVLCVALLARFSVCLICWDTHEAFLTDYSSHYLVLSHQLRTHYEYSSDPVSGAPSMVTPPLYPMFVALADTLLGESTQVLLMTQALLGMVTCGLVYALAYTLLGRGAGMVSGLLVAVDPASISASLLISHEALFLFFLALGAWSLALALSRDVRWGWPLAGASLGLASLTWHESLWLWAVVLAAAIPWVCKRRTTRRVLRVSSFLLAFLLIVGPWVGRNYHSTGSLVFATEAGVRWLERRQAGLRMSQEGLELEEAIAQLKQEAEESDANEKPLPEHVLSRRYRARAIGDLLAHPVYLFRSTVSSLTRAYLYPERDLAWTVIRASFPQNRVKRFLLTAYLALASAAQGIWLVLVLLGAVHGRSWRLGGIWWGPVIAILCFSIHMPRIDCAPCDRYVVVPALAILLATELRNRWLAISHWLRRDMRRFGKVAYSGAIIGSGGDRGATL